MTSKTIYVGIDPGSNGGFAAIDWTGQPYMIEKMPDTEGDLSELFQVIAQKKDLRAIIEKVHSMPGNSARSMFTFGQNYGMLRMGMICHKIVFTEVLPREWQKEFGLAKRKSNESKTQYKNRLKGKAQQLFPSVNVTLWNADCLLIAEFARRRGF